MIYDCDGVILNSREANNAFYNGVLAHFGLPPMTPEQEAYCFMATAMESLHHILPPRFHGDIGRVTRREVNYERDILPLLKLMPGFLGFAEELHSLGIAQAVATNRTAEGFQRVLDFFALPPYFDPVITVSNARPKPSPEGVSKICSAWETAPRDVLFVGDSPNDKRAAEDGGAVFAAFNAGELEGSIVVGDYAALRDAIAPALPGGR